jgi:hypothetical protein
MKKGHLIIVDYGSEGKEEKNTINNTKHTFFLASVQQGWLFGFCKSTQAYERLPPMLGACIFFFGYGE